MIPFKVNWELPSHVYLDFTSYSSKEWYLLKGQNPAVVSVISVSRKITYKKDKNNNQTINQTIITLFLILSSVLVFFCEANCKVPPFVLGKMRMEFIDIAVRYNHDSNTDYRNEHFIGYQWEKWNKNSCILTICRICKYRNIWTW